MKNYKNIEKRHNEEEKRQDNQKHSIYEKSNKHMEKLA